MEQVSLYGGCQQRLLGNEHSSISEHKEQLKLHPLKKAHTMQKRQQAHRPFQEGACGQPCEPKETDSSMFSVHC